MKRMKVIMVHGNPVSPDPRVSKEAKSLVKGGYDVMILAWDREGIANKKEQNADYTISRFKFKAPSGQLKIVFYLPIWCGFEFFWLIKNKWDIVHSSDFSTMIPALLASKIKRKRVIYDIYDFYADNTPPYTPKILRQVISTLDKFLMKFTDGIIIADESRYIQIEDKTKKAIVITNSPEDVLDTNIKTATKTKNRKFLIFYAGHLSKVRGFSQILAATADLNDVQIVIAGFGRDENELIRMFSNAKNVKFIGKITYQEVIAWTLKSDLLFALYDPIIPNHKYASPNKLFEAMMCGKSIIVSGESSMAEIVEKNKCGIVVDYNDINTIKKAIIELKESPELREQLGTAGRRAYEKEYNWKIMEKRLIDAYKELTNCPLTSREVLDKNE